MDSAITLQQILAVGGFLVSFCILAFGLWKYFEGKVERAKSDAKLANEALKVEVSLIEKDLAEHKLHVAQTYTTKAGMAEQTAQIMKALDAVSSKIDYTNQRLDAWTQPRAARATRG